MNIDNFKKNELLSRHTTFRVGGPAKYFFEAKKEKDILDAVKIAKKNKIYFFILGGGSNILFSDKSFNGLIIKIKTNKIKFNKENLVEAGAGVVLGNLIRETTNKKLSGLERFAGIPGTVGGAIFGNAGLGKDGPWIGDRVEKIKLLMPDGKIKEVSKKWMKFSYRHSRLKEIKSEKRPIILSVILKLKKGNKKESEKAIKEKFETRKRYPTKPSAGCIFKNLPDQPTAKLIDKCGLKGKKIGGAQVSKKHANFIINTGNATARNVLDLMDLIKKEVRKKFKINLEKEIQII